MHLLFMQGARGSIPTSDHFIKFRNLYGCKKNKILYIPSKRLFIFKSTSSSEQFLKPHFHQTEMDFQLFEMKSCVI